MNIFLSQASSGVPLRAHSAVNECPIYNTGTIMVGVIRAYESDIRVSGTTSFQNNVAGRTGGERERFIFQHEKRLLA